MKQTHLTTSAHDQPTIKGTLLLSDQIGRPGCSVLEINISCQLLAKTYPLLTPPLSSPPDPPTTRVHQTVRNRTGYRGYRSNRPGPVPVPGGQKPAQIQILNLNSKKWKNPKKFLKILQVATNLMVSNFFQIFIHLVYFASI